MNEYYQLVLTYDETFQKNIDVLISRLAAIKSFELADGSRQHVRVSKKRIVHAGIMSLSDMTLEELKTYADNLVLNFDRKSPEYPPKHTAIQLDRYFADLARLKSAKMSVNHNFRHPTKAFIHFGVMSLVDCDDTELKTLVRSSILVEKGELRQRH